MNNDKPIFVTKPFLPLLSEYKKFLSKIWKTKCLTNQGSFAVEFETKIASLLNVKYFHYVTNGTLALQLALSGLGIHEGEIITTPFSYCALITSILWERCEPVFCDIEPDNFTIDVNKIEEKITSKTKAILPCHVFGYACKVDEIQKIADKYKLKVIYDGAHAFLSKYKNKSLLDYGDVITCSFHATK